MTQKAPTTKQCPPTILRMKKLKSWSAVATSGGHTWRTLRVPHADLDRTHLNEDWRAVTSPEALRTAIEGRLALITAATAKSPVLCVEYLITARSDAFAEHGGETDAPAYFRAALAFLEERHGIANVVAANVQYDETAPHLVVYVVPLVERPARTMRKSVFAGGRDGEGKLKRVTKEIPQPADVVLSADHYNGTPAKLAMLQTAFADRVATKHGLARGLELSAASHTTNKQHHEALARALAGHIGLLPEDLERKGRLWSKEAPEEQAARLSELIREHYAPTVARAATAGHDRRRANEMAETAARHNKRYKAAAKALAVFTEELSDAQQDELRQVADRLRTENHERARREAEEARQKREEAEQERERQAVRELERLELRERQLIERLKVATPLAFACAESALRRECWGLLAARDDLEEAFERMTSSPLFIFNGELSDQGRQAVAEEQRAKAGTHKPDAMTKPQPSEASVTTPLPTEQKPPDM